MFWKKNHKYYNTVLLIILSSVVLTALSGKLWWNSVTLYPLAAFSLLQMKRQEIISNVLKNGFVVCCFLFFLLHISQLLMEVPQKLQNFEIEKKLGFAILPLIMMPLIPLPAIVRERLIKISSVYLIVLFIFFIITAINRFNESGKTEEFFYHRFVSPLNHHAIYLSAFIALFIIWLVYNNTYKTITPIQRILFITFLFGLLVLLSSKSIMVITLFILVYEVFRKSFTAFNKKKYYITITSVLLFVTLIFLTQNPFSKRFREVAATDLSVLNKKEYATDMYFNAIQFRLIAWKYSSQIINEKKAWVFGVGAGNAQSELNNKYRNAKMYVGESEKEPGGYLDFNAHNQFVQTYLQTGIIGLLLLIGMLFFFFRDAYLQQNRMLFYTAVLLIVFFLSESVLEGQYGLLLFLYLPKLFYTIITKNYKFS